MERHNRIRIAFVAIVLVAATVVGVRVSLSRHASAPAPATSTRVAESTVAPAPAPVMQPSGSALAPADNPAPAPAARKRSVSTRKPAGRMSHAAAALPPAPATQVTVKFASGVTPAQQEALGRRLGFEVVSRIPSIGWVVVTPTKPGRTAGSLASALSGAPGVASAEPDVHVRIAMTPNDPMFSMEWDLHNTGQTGGTAGADIKATKAWDIANGSGTLVAVSDEGVDFAHPDLAGQQWVNPGEIPGNGIDDEGDGYIDDVNGWDFYHNDGTVFDPGDGDRHGTHVAGTVGAATNNGIGVAGVAGGTRIISVKFLGPQGGSGANAASTITYAVNRGARAVNCSWVSDSFSQPVADAVNYAASKGVLIIAAAGNSGRSTDATPAYPASLPATNVVSVAATDHNDQLAWFSNRGANSVDLGAPGVNITSPIPKLGAALLIDKSPYKVVYLAFPAESISNAAARDAFITRSVGALATSTTNPVMVVDDSWPGLAGENPATRLGVYTSALSAAGYTSVTTWSTQTSGTPSAASMAGHTVVWFTGAASYGISVYSAVGTLDSNDRLALGAFLDGGGRLLISSGDMGYDQMIKSFGYATFYRTYIHAKWAGDDPWVSTATGVSGTPLAGVSGSVNDLLRGGDGNDVIWPYDGYASVIATWPDYATISGTSMAAPHVTGVAALVMQRYPNMNATDVRNRLFQTADPIAALSGITVTGARLDAFSAVDTGVPVPVGASVTASTEGVSATFSNVTTRGWLTITRMAPRQSPPPGFKFVPGGYYDITATGTFNYPVSVSIPFNKAAVSDVSNLRCFHYTGGAWTDVTGSVDASAGVATLSASSFSDFALAEPSAATGTGTDTPAETPATIAALLALGVAISLGVGVRASRQ